MQIRTHAPQLLDEIAEKYQMLGKTDSKEEKRVSLLSQPGKCGAKLPIYMLDDRYSNLTMQKRSLSPDLHG